MSALAALCLFLAQESSTYTRFTTDVNGNRVEGPVISESRSKNGFDVTERLQSINGRLAPRERIEERVIRDDASGRVVERVIQRYNQTGDPGPPEKTLIEERKHADGLTIRSTTWRGDLNGNLQVAERSLEEIHKSGQTENAVVTIERPTINGSLEVVEKKSGEKTAVPGGYREDATTYRKGENGFYPALRLVTAHSGGSGQTTDQTAEYEVGSSGRLELHSRTVATTTKRPDGSQVSETDHYGAAVAGTVNSPESGLKLKERDVVERSRDAGGGVVETTSVRRPSISEPGVLGPARVLSETVCRGKCP